MFIHRLLSKYLGKIIHNRIIALTGNGQTVSNVERWKYTHPTVCSAVYEVSMHAKTAGNHVREPDLKVKYNTHHSCSILEALWIERSLSGSAGG